MCTPLKHALVDHSEPAWKVACRAGISEIRLSKIARGQIQPADHEKERLAETLQRSITTIFPNKKEVEHVNH